MRKFKLQSLGIIEFVIKYVDVFQLFKYYQQMKQIIALVCLLLAVLASKGNKPVYTQVTCLYDIKRGELANQFQRSFDYYLKHFEQLLKTEMNLIIFGTKQLKQFVWKRRSPTNTIFIVKELQSFKDHWYYPYVQRIRQKRLQQPNFYKKTHPQYSLQYYNMVVMYKTYMLDIAMKHDTFNTDFVAWTDGGLTHVTSDTVLQPDSHLMKWFSVFQPQWVFFTYLENQPTFFDGYERGAQRYLDGKVMGLNEGILSGFFGGYVEAVRDVSTVFENLLRITLENGDMNSEQHVLTIMPFRYPLLIPTTCHIQFGGFNSRLHLHSDLLRKPERPRFFKLSFDSQDERFHFHSDFLVIPEHPRQVKPTSETQENKEKQQVLKPQPTVEIGKEKKQQQCAVLKSTSESEETKKKQQGIMQQFLKDHISGYKRILFRELLCLALLIIIEVAILRNKCKQRQNKNMPIPIPNRQPYPASITIINNQQSDL